MQERNFEKQVKEKMEELSLNPSTPVWMKVEEQLRRKKEKRRIIFWIFPIGLLLAGLLTWTLYKYTNKNQDQTIATEASKNEGNNNSTNEQEKNNGFTKQESGNDASENLSGNDLPGRSGSDIRTQTTPPVVKQTFNKKSFSTFNKREDPFKKENIASNKKHSNKISVSIDSDYTNVKKEKKIIPHLVNTDEALVSRTDNKTVDTAVSSIVPPADENINSSPANATVDAGKTNAPVNTKDNSNTVKTPFNKNWTIIPYFSTGTTNLNYPVSMNKSNYDVFNSGGTAMSPYLPPPSSPAPSGGISLTAGVQFQKSITERLKFTTGIGYRLAGTHIRVGEKVEEDSVITRNSNRIELDKYYKSGSSHDYANHYHFIDIPVGINWQMNKRIPLELGIGISFSQMFANNALTFDRSSGLYYKNNDVLNRTQLNFSASLTYRIVKLKGKELHAGPYLLNSFTPLEKGSSGRLFSAGIGIKMTF